MVSKNKLFSKTIVKPPPVGRTTHVNHVLSRFNLELLRSLIAKKN